MYKVTLITGTKKSNPTTFANLEAAINAGAKHLGLNPLDLKESLFTDRKGVMHGGHDEDTNQVMIVKA